LNTRTDFNFTKPRENNPWIFLNQQLKNIQNTTCINVAFWLNWSSRDEKEMIPLVGNLDFDIFIDRIDLLNQTIA